MVWPSKKLICKSLTLTAGFTFLLAGIGCTQGQPEFSNIDPSLIPQPKFSGSINSSVTISSVSTPTLISGECDRRSTSLKIKIDGATSWGDMAQYAVGGFDADCSDGNFSFSLKGIENFGFSSGSAAVITLLIKSVTLVGDSNPSQIVISYSPGGSASPPGMRISSGGGLSSSANFKSVSGMSSLKNNLQESTNFKVKMGRAATAP